MHCLYLLLWIFIDGTFSASTSTCLIHDKCLEDLREFTQADEFHVYTTLEEAEKACSEAKDAYLCVTSAPKCREPSDGAMYSPILRGGSRLLNEFCGFRAKRRPCCALRTAYLEYSSCYEEVSDRLNDCNDKYRTSLEMILGMKDESEQNEQRYCSMQWLGNCVKKATQSYCGKTAAQIIRSYFMKAGQHHKQFVVKTNFCHDSLYGFEEVSEKFCQQKHFDKCHVHLMFLHEYLIEDRLTDEEKFVSICTGIYDSFECLSRAFNRCLYNKQGRKFERMEENETDKEKNSVCLAKDNVLRSYQGNVHCLVEHIPQLQHCKAQFENPAKYTNHTMPFYYYNQYFCGLLSRFEHCMISTADSSCGAIGKNVMKDIIEMAAINFHQKCNA